MDYFFVLCVILFVIFILVIWIINKYSKNTYFCEKLNWHHDTWIEKHNDNFGYCLKCNKNVIKNEDNMWRDNGRS